MTDLDHRCGIYADRPGACRRYPNEDAQILFESCVFVRREEDRLVIKSSTSSSVGEAEACRSCGRCCFGWVVDTGDCQPVVRCSHLEVTVLELKAFADPERLRMLKVERTEPFL